MLIFISIAFFTPFFWGFYPKEQGVASNHSIYFLPISIDSAFAMAKSENKLLFIDVYTDWCGPCKKMEKVVFSDKAIAKTYNAQFISIRINAESPEHKNFVEKLNLNSFPTLLYYSSDGDLLERVGGYKGVDELLEITKKVIDSKNNPTNTEHNLSGFEKSLKELDYFAKLNDMTYFSAFNLFKDEFIIKNPFDSMLLIRICDQIELFPNTKNPAYIFLLDNIDTIRYKIGYRVDYSIALCIRDDFNRFYTSKDPVKLKHYIDTCTALDKQKLIIKQDLIKMYERQKKQIEKGRNKLLSTQTK